MDNQNQRVTEQAANKIEEIRALLEEAYGFAALSPRGMENINAALDLLDELTPTTRQAAPEAPTGFEQAIGAWLSARDYWQDEENEHVKAAWSNVLKFAAPAPATQQAGAPVAWIATDLDGRAGVGFTKEAARREAGEGCTEFIPLYDLGGPAATTASTDPFAEADARPPNIHRRLVFALFPVATTASASDPKCKHCNGKGQVNVPHIPGGWAKCGECNGTGRAPAPARKLPSIHSTIGGINPAN